jgi:drug/metabolite transporter (DMT)-like permease
MGVLLGLSAALFWGTSDFCAANVARKLGALRAILCTQSVGLLAIGAILLFQGRWPQPAPGVLPAMLAIGVAQAAGVFLFYRAFEIGKLSTVAPITSGFAVITAILAVLSGDRPGPFALGGALLLIGGVFFITRYAAAEDAEDVADPRATLRGVPEAILAAFAYGGVFWALDFVVPSLGTIWPLAALRVFTLLILSSVLLAMRFRPAKNSGEDASAENAVEKHNWKSKNLLWMVLAVAFSDTLAWISFNAGTQGANVAIVTALGSLYSAVAVFYGCIFWRERLQKLQWIGVGLILLGVLLVGFK